MQRLENGRGLYHWLKAKHQNLARKLLTVVGGLAQLELTAAPEHSEKANKNNQLAQLNE